MDLGLDRDELDKCVQCALCLPHCPTFRVTGEDTRSPRGRIGLMRAVQYHDAPLTDEVVESFNTCVQCRGCEPACPSGVPFGRLIEQTRATLVGEGHRPPVKLRLALAALDHHRALLAGSTALAVAQRAHLVPPGLGLPESLPLRRPGMGKPGDDVHLFTGCVMDAWQRDVHVAAKQVLAAMGVGAIPTGSAAPCCGALHQHAGMADKSRSMAAATVAAFSDDKPILVDSAGCGAAMKEYGTFLGTPEASAFSARVFDIHEWIAPRVAELPDATPLDLSVAVQDPCHLRHVQKVHESVRSVLRPFVRELVELDDQGLCCGAGGAFSIVQPALAGLIRDRKTGSIDRANADLVVSANPGCSLHLRQAGHEAVHPIQLVARALAGS